MSWGCVNAGTRKRFRVQSVKGQTGNGTLLQNLERKLTSKILTKSVSMNIQSCGQFLGLKSPRTPHEETPVGASQF